MRTYITVLVNSIYAIYAIWGYSPSSTYTPTISNTSNVSSSTARVCFYTVSGRYITVTGSVNITATAASTSTTFNMSLPLASNLASGDLDGVISGPGVFISEDATNDQATTTFNSGVAVGTNPQEYKFVYTYTVK